MEEQGTDVGLGVFAPKGTKIPSVVEAIQASIDKDEAWVCDSLEELAEKAGMDYETLKENVDDIFRKSSVFILSIVILFL